MHSTLEGRMIGNGGRSKVREAERDLFGHGLRQKASPILEAPKRRGRSNVENVAPDGVTNVSVFPNSN